MKKGKSLTLKTGLLSILLLVLLIGSISALTASIGKPRMVLYRDYVKGQSIIINESVLVNNDNDYSIWISMEPKGVWKDRVIISEPEFEMNAEESREAFYTATIDEPGYYRGDIIVTFSDALTKSTLAAAQDFVVIVRDENGKVPNLAGGITGSTILDVFSDKAGKITFGIIIGLVALLIVVGLVIKFRGNSK